MANQFNKNVNERIRWNARHGNVRETQRHHTTFRKLLQLPSTARRSHAPPISDINNIIFPGWSGLAFTEYAYPKSKATRYAYGISAGEISQWRHNLRLLAEIRARRLTLSLSLGFPLPLLSHILSSSLFCVCSFSLSPFYPLFAFVIPFVGNG